ncbi:hypothetical protein [Devosia nitrariae]|uniref:DUF3618 domain-containing protein n=1 Tax=Devosia nitrariae TaxID=2071872 RepID=A0ABQ5WC04_9HYPH|nr:hypothetical protein [Devosia nitrariae]GLQ57352.1 hypothetical protein GCM10010862_46110 [Devosia nitrariae]
MAINTTPTKAIEQQINDLRDQVGRITHLLTDRGVDVKDLRAGAQGVAGGLATTARGAVERVRHETADVAEAAREHPVATTTVLASVAAVAFALGFLLASNAAYDHRHRWF